MQEFSQISFNAPAEYRTSVGVMGIGKKGANNFHGEIFARLDNEALNARQVGTGSRPAARTNKRWSYQASGPVWIPGVYDGRDQTFFHFMYQPQKRRSGRVFRDYAIPTARMRAGDLNEYFAVSKCATEATIPCPVNPYTGQPFPKNVIPDGMINPIARNIMNNTGLLPLPNTGGPGRLFDNFNFTAFSVFESQWLNFRFDHNITDSNTIYFTHYRFSSLDNNGAEGNPLPNSIFIEDADTRAMSIGNSHTFSPTVINEFQLSWSRQQSQWAPGDIPGKAFLNDLLGITDVGGRTLREGIGTPKIIVQTLGQQRGALIGGFNPFPTTLLGGTFAGETQYEDGEPTQIKNNISIHRGKHLIKTGIEVRHQSPHMFNTIKADSFGRFDFTGAFSGYDFADLMLGLPFETKIDGVRPRAEARHNEVGWFLQDDWKVTPRLTLTPGIRFQHYGVPSEVNDTIYNFDFENARVVVPNDQALRQTNPNFPIPIVTASEAGYPDGLRNFKGLLIDPRLGIAFRLTETFVVRAGYGVYHVPFVAPVAWATSNVFGTFDDRAGILAGLEDGPYQLTEVFGPNEIVNGVPLLTFDRPFPSGVVGPQLINGVGINTRREKWPYDQQWNLTLEKELPGAFAGRASYVGAKGSQWPYYRNLQQPRPSTEPFDPSDTPFDSKLFRKVHSLDLGGNSTHHGLELELTRQFSSGLYFRGWFAWLKSLNDVQGGLFGSSTGNPILATFDRASEKGWQNGVTPLVSRWSGVYQLPFGQGQKFGADASAFLNQLIGGWNIASSFNTRAHSRITPRFSGSDSANMGIDGGRPDILPGCDPFVDRGGGGGIAWNRSCFATPPNGRFGTAFRGILRRPSGWHLALNAFKEWRLVPSLEQSPYFKLEFYSNNVLNHANCDAGPRTNNISDPNFGWFDCRGRRSINFRLRISF